MSRPTEYDVAVHEAAHGAMAQYVGFPVLRIDLDQRCTVLCFPVQKHLLAADYRRYPALTTGRVRDTMAVLLAGHLAEHTSFAGTGDGDDIDGWRQAWQRLPARALAWPILRAQGQAQARSFLRAREFQAPMERLVHALLRERVLMGARLAALLEPFGVSDEPTPRRQVPLPPRRVPPPRPARASVPPPQDGPLGPLDQWWFAQHRTSTTRQAPARATAPLGIPTEHDWRQHGGYRSVVLRSGV